MLLEGIVLLMLEVMINSDGIRTGISCARCYSGRRLRLL